MFENNGRGDRIRTSDLTLPNDRRGKSVSICLFESCSHQGISSVLHSFPFFTIRYRLIAKNSVHKLATRTPWFSLLAHLASAAETGLLTYFHHALVQFRNAGYFTLTTSSGF